MHALESIFPADEFSLIGLILALPALGAFVNGVFGKRLGKDGVRTMALVAIGGAFLASLTAFLMLKAGGEEAEAGFTWTAWHWMDLSTENGMGSTPVEVKFMVDRLNSVMMLVITGVGFLIHLYASTYMWDDSRERQDGGYHRFFAYLNLFCFAMLVLVMGASLPMMFVGWEGVGLCSYLLIGFWYSDDANAAAGKKAFVANRIGDFGLLAAMALLLSYTGALDWAGIGKGAGGLMQPVQVFPWGTGVHLPAALHGFQDWLNTPREVSAATLVSLCLFLGAAGKSAQFPLYVWLPDAMAGPTPVSALIHAATMVTAGVYLVCRMSGVFLLSPTAMAVVASVGAFTALGAASIGLAQHDIKKVLAYSTVSQLGFMFIGVGVGAFTAGFFHVFTHAFFKACLFLGAGSVIHAMHAGIHDTAASQDMRNMGGLRKHLPITHATYLISCLAIAGVPPLAGFWSKDEILYRAFVNRIGEEGAGWPAFLGPTIYVVGLVAATMTAFYMFRSYFLTFWGDFRGWKIDPTMTVAHAHGHAGEEHGASNEAHGHDDHGHGHDDHGHGEHHAHDPSQPGPAPHESPWQMSYVLAILAFFAAFAGFLNAGMIHLTPMEHWLEPVFKGAEEFVHESHASEVALAIPGVLVGLFGIGAAYWVYVLQGGAPAKKLTESIPGLYRLVFDKWRVDELYRATIIDFVDSLADTAKTCDKWIVDGILARLTAGLVALFGTILRAFQTGVVHAYAAIMVVGFAGVGLFFVQPHARALVHEASAGKYVVEAGPGLGYGYRWSTRSAGAPDTADFTGAASTEVDASDGAPKTIKLEVRNGLGLVGTTTVVVGGPREGEKPTAANDLRPDVQQGIAR